MKKLQKLQLNYLLLAAFFFLSATACTDNKKNDSQNYQNEQVNERDTTSMKKEFAQEMEEYRIKIDNRLNELDREIEELKVQREKEKDKKKKDQYSKDIEKRESSRTQLKSKLDSLGIKAEAEWEEFKREVDTFFDGDIDNDGK